MPSPWAAVAVLLGRSLAQKPQLIFFQFSQFNFQNKIASEFGLSVRSCDTPATPICGDTPQRPVIFLELRNNS
jgi:hypothetical protein